MKCRERAKAESFRFQRQQNCLCKSSPENNNSLALAFISYLITIKDVLGSTINMRRSLHRLCIWQQLLVCVYLVGAVPSSSNQRRKIKQLPAYYSDLDAPEEHKEPPIERRYLQDNKLHIPIPESPDAHLVTSLPLLESSEPLPLSWAGHLPADGNDKKYLWYWLFAPEAPDGAVEEDAPLVLWLNGGPGTSSLLGLFIENGPFRFIERPGNLTLIRREHSWHKAPAYVLYVDQPVGTGFSFTTDDSLYPESNWEVGIDFYYFLQHFFALHADKFVTKNGQGRLSTKNFFITGESHAGQYIPGIMDVILQRNDELQGNPSDDVKSLNKIFISLKAGAIGNGSTDIYWQYNTGPAAYGHGLIGLQQLQERAAAERACQALMDNGSSDGCMHWSKVVQNILGDDKQYKTILYDVRRAKGPGLPYYPLYENVMRGYLMGSRPEWFGFDESVTPGVMKALHATALYKVYKNSYFGKGVDHLREALDEEDTDIHHGAIPHVQSILKHEDVRLLFYNGIHDLACDHVGNELFLSNMEWKYQKEWLLAERYVWRAPSEKPGAASGYYKEFANLGFLKILDAGHFVPMDVPSVALDMLRTFLNNGSFATFHQEIPQVSTDLFGNWCGTDPKKSNSSIKTNSSERDDVTPTNKSDEAVLQTSEDPIPPWYLSPWFLMGIVFTLANSIFCIVTCRATKSTPANHQYSVIENKPSFADDDLDVAESSFQDNT